MHAILWSVVSWLLREVVVKFVVFSALFAVVSFLVPYAIEFLGALVDAGGLTNAFAGITPGMWYFLDLFRLDIGLPLCISALCSGFLIRRLPVIG